MKRGQLYVVCILILLLLGCTGEGDSQRGPGQGTSGTLLVWHNWPYPESQLIDEIIDRFVETRPDVRIISEYVPSEEITERFITQANLGFAPDLLIGEETFLLNELVKRGLLRDLANINIDTHELMPETVDALTIGDAQYAIPFAAYTDVLFYNTNIVETPATTLNELLAAAKSGQRVALSTGFYHAYWGIKAHGGTVVDQEGNVALDSGFIDWLSWLDNAQKEPTVVFNAVYSELYQDFINGETAYFVGNSFDLPSLQNALGEDAVGVALLPGIDEPTGGFQELETMAISRNSAQPTLASELIEFFINTSQQRRIALSNFGQIPLHRRATFNTRLAPIPATLIAQRRLATIVPLEHVEIEDILRVHGTDIYRQVLEGNLSPEEGRDALVEAVELGEVNENFMQLLLAQSQIADHQIVAEESDPSIDLFLNIFRSIRAFLLRSMFRAQLVAMALILFISLAFSNLFWRRYQSRIEETVLRISPTRFSTAVTFILHVLRAVTFPFVGLLIIELTRRWFISQNRISGMLGEYEQLFSALILFQIIVALLYQTFDRDEARRIHYTFFLPGLFTLIMFFIVDGFADVSQVAEVVLTQLFNSPLTIRAFFFSTIGMYLWIGLVRALRNFLYWLLMRIGNYDAGELESTLTLISYLLFIIGFGYVFSLFDFDPTTTAAITGGLSVGIGFGMQQILANFISGLLLLFERSLQPGDVIEVDNQLNVVQDFSIRATRVRTVNNEELIIPNQTFFTSSFKTYTGTDSKVRISLIVETDCAIEPDKVIALMNETASTNPDVISDPAPSVFLLNYGNNVATFQLNVWIIEPMRRSPIMSQLKIDIWKMLKEHNVALPFPEMELLFPKPVPIKSDK